MICEKPFTKVGQTVKKWNKLTPQMKEFYKPFPCGSCFNCRINQARVWKNRIILERKASKDSAFVTLTYNNDHLVYDDKGNMILNKRELQNYLKRLRNAHPSKSLRYFAVGEYGNHGERKWNPHYHLILFSNYALDHGAIREKWTDYKGPIGFVSVGDVGDGSASYIAKYCQKKATRDYYENINGRPKEFALMSRQNGGIGIGAINEASKVINEKEDYQKTIRDIIFIGRKPMPLGRYLTRKLAEKTGVSEKEFTKRFNNILLEYNDPDNQDFDNQAQFVNKLLDENRGKRLSSIKRNSLKKERRSL